MISVILVPQAYLIIDIAPSFFLTQYCNNRLYRVLHKFFMFVEWFKKLNCIDITGCYSSSKICINWFENLLLFSLVSSSFSSYNAGNVILYGFILLFYLCELHRPLEPLLFCLRVLRSRSIYGHPQSLSWLMPFWVLNKVNIINFVRLTSRIRSYSFELNLI